MPNLIQNPGAETGDTTFTEIYFEGTLTADNTQAHSGSYSFKFVAPGTNPNEGIQFTSDSAGTLRIPVMPGASYTFQVWVKGAAGTENMAIGMDWRTAVSGGSHISNSLTTPTLTTGWLMYQMTGVAPPTANAANVLVMTADQEAATFWVDDADFIPPESVTQNQMFIMPPRTLRL